MKTLRSARVLVYLLAACIVISSAMSAWHRGHEEIWASESMRGVRMTMDVFAAVISLFGIAVVYGLWADRPGGRSWGISFSVVTLSLYFGLGTYAAYLAAGNLTLPRWDTIAMGVLSLACIIALCFSGGAHDG